MTRIAFLHTGAVVIPPVMELAGRLLPDAATVNYLDDKIVADLDDSNLQASVDERLEGLVRAARSAGADAVMLTCSSISGYASGLSERVGIPVLRIDEAMADQAVATGARIAVIATLPTTLAPTIALIDERAQITGASPAITSEVVEGAFAAVASGDRTTHDALVGAAITRLAAEADVVVLAQASMAGAAATVSVEIPVLTSLESGIARLRDTLTAA